MQKDPLVALLVGALCVCSLFTFAETVAFELHLHQLHTLQPMLVRIQNGQTLANALMSDTVEYGKHNQTVNPIIQAALRPPAQPAAK
jgi:hypothetical protein